MAHEPPSKSVSHRKLVIRNIGLLLSGDLANPILDADTVIVVSDRITAYCLYIDPPLGRAGSDGAALDHGLQVGIDLADRSEQEAR